jgi:hypothetical protein
LYNKDLRHLLLLLLPLASFGNPAVDVLSQVYDYANAKATTVYAASGDHIFYCNVKASKGMLLLTEDGVVPFAEGLGNRVVVAVVKPV